MPSSSSARASKRLKGASAQVVNHGTRPELDKEDQENEEPTCTPADGLTEYERLRLRQMQENQQRMEELQLLGLAANLQQYTAKPAAPATTKGVKKSTKKAAHAPPARQSARLRGVAADPALAGGVKSETAGGKVELVHAAAADAAREEAKRGRLSQGPLPFHCEDAGEGDESAVAFLALLRSHSPASTSGQSLGASGAAFPTKLSRKTVPKLTLDPSDVAKVTRDGTTGIVFHPSSALLLASADKQGNVGFWGVGRKGGHGDSGGSGSGGDTDLFCSIKVHDQYISAITWLQGGEPHVLATSSYDGSVRLLDVNAAAFDLLKGLPEGIEISTMSCSDANTIYLGDNDGQLSCIDRRQGGPGTVHQVHDRRLNTIEFMGDGHTACTSSSDSSIKIWDLRKMGRPLQTLAHLKSCHAAVFAPDGSQRLLSTSYDDTLRVWSPTGGKAQGSPAKGLNWQQTLSIRHNNNTGRWIIPFRAIWGPAGDWLACANMHKGIDLHCTQTGDKLAVLSNDHMTAIPSRLCVHPEHNVLAAATGSGRVHLWQL